VGRRVHLRAFEVAVTVASAWALVLGCSTLGGPSSSSTGDSDSKPEPEPVSSGPDSGLEGAAGAGAAGGAGVEEAESDASVTDASDEDGGDGSDGGEVLVCVPEVESGPVPRLRPGCPAEKPVASRCDFEGLRCLYESDAGAGCYEEMTCLFWLWSPLGEVCRSGEAVETNGAQCPEEGPVDGEPCEPEGLECAYEPCSSDTGAVRAVCFCGRFRVEKLGCPSLGGK
jgi:hypothetical protein